MASVIDICNLGLGHIKHNKKVSDITSPTNTEEEWCKSFFPIALKEVMEFAEWSFLTRTISGTVIGTAPSGWGYQYQQPNLLINIIKVTASGDDKPTVFKSQSHVDHGNVILSDVECADIHYIHEISDPVKYSSGFVIALSWLLASFLSSPVGKGGKQATDAYERYIILVGVASARDGKRKHDGNVTTTEKGYTPSAIKARGVTPRTIVQVNLI